MKIKKISVVIPAAIAISILSGINSQAATGWVYENDNWKYYDKYESQVYTTWIKGNDGVSYYLNEYGVMARNAWIDNCYADNNGAMVTDQWRKLKPEEGREEDGSSAQYWYYFSNNGTRVEEKWKTIGEKKYYFDDQGRMYSGWIEGTYFLGDQNDGAMKTGWVKAISPADAEAGVKETSSNKYWYYLSSSGKLNIPALESGYTAAAKKIGEVNYAFDGNGRMLSGWVNVSATKNSSDIQDYKYYGNADDGAMKTGWQYVQAPSKVSSGTNWYHLNAKGVARVGQTSGTYKKSDMITIDNKSYLIDKYGRVLYGLQWMDSELYYLGTKDQRTIQTGLIDNISQSGSKTAFFFITSGTDKGKGLTGVHSGQLFYKGRIQKASADEKFRIVSITIDGTNRNYVVNTSGDIKTSAKVTRFTADEDEMLLKTNAKGILTEIDDETVDQTAVLGVKPVSPVAN